MDIIKFKVKNYRSIKDSGDCYLTNKITILAGKNESGKTSLLEALEDFDADKKIRESAKPIQDTEKIPEISVVFKIGSRTLNNVFHEINLPKRLTAGLTLEITKQFPDTYFLSKDASSQLQLDDETQLREELDNKAKVFKKIFKKYPALGADIADFNNDTEPEDLKNIILSFESATTPNINNVSNETDKKELQEAIEIFKKYSDVLPKIEKIEEDFLNVLKEKYIPYFVLFNSFDDIFPNKIPFADLESNEWVKDLSVISDLNANTIKGDDDRGKEMHQDKVNISLNDDYKKFWTQDISKLSVNWDSEHLYFWIKEDGYPYEPSLRSKGRQWHLSFYIKVSARAKEGVPNIILIDEPGLFLHAKAQKDILGKLDDCAKNTQLIFSTHSPYLLEPENLERIRLIYRTKKGGTKVQNKVHALADKETLTPILTAIGLELNDGIQNIDRINNIVVEGPSDIFYLQAFLLLSKKERKIHFIYGGGAGNMPFVGTILQGWGCVVLYLYDNDQGKKDGEKNLKSNWVVKKELIETISENTGSIEDLFSKKDFKKNVLSDEEKEYTSTNNEYLKKTKKDKVLLSRLFLQTAQEGEIKLEDSTITKIDDLLDKILSKFK